MTTEDSAPATVWAMEPMAPDRRRAELAEFSRSIFIEAGALSAVLPADATRDAVAALVREMNSYYSNLIEGHKTLPGDIERALQADYSSDEKQRENQHLAAAHIRVQEEMEQWLGKEPDLEIHSVEFLCWLHGRFYACLPEEFRYGRTESGRRFRVVPGMLRTFNVSVGAHTPPDPSQLPACLDRFRSVYADARRPATDSLSAFAAAHHRLAWIHPFGDGNGRVARLHSHAALIRQRVDGLGLWTLSRGLARNRGEYYRHLAQADQPRRDDYDGRGSLTAAGLADFCVFFLETVLDQIRFMGGLLNLPKLLDRIENYLYREAIHIPRHKERLARLLKAAALEGPVSRGRVPDIVGLKPSAARQVTRLGLTEGLLSTPTPKGPLHIAFPAKVLDAYFPRLFLDLPIDEGDR